MSLSCEEQRFFQRMYWVRLSFHVAAVGVLVYWLRTPVTLLDWTIFLVILFCLDRVVTASVVTVGYWFWRKAFGHKYD